MDEPPETQRIEIELTPHESVGARRARSSRGAGRESTGGHDVGPHTGGVVPPDRFGTERQRLVASVSVVAVAALLFGIVLGRIGSREEASPSDSPAPTTVPATSVVTTTGRSTGTDTVPPAGQVLTPPTPPGPRLPTTTSIEPETTDGSSVPLVKNVIGIDPSVTMVDLEVVGLNSQGEVVRIDIATGTTVTADLDVDQFGPSSLYAGEGWVLIPSFDQRGSTVLFDDGTVSSIDVGGSWPLLPGSTSGRFWRTDPVDEDGRRVRLVEMTIDGDTTGSVIELDGYFPGMTDPLGGVVVEAPGGSYVVAPESTTRVTSGRVLALGRERALVHECDAQLECGYFVTDRTTDDRRPLTLDPALGDRPTLDASAWWSFERPMNASEDAVLIVTWSRRSSGGPSYGVLDLVTGEFTNISDSAGEPVMSWAPDGTVFWLDAGRLMMFDRSTGESVLLSDALPSLSAFALVPLRSSDATPDPPPSTVSDG